MSCETCWEVYEKFGNEGTLTCILNCQNTLANLSSLSQRAWALFQQLRAKRPLGFGAVGSIPYTEIQAMYDMKDIPQYMRKHLTYRIELLDNIELNFLYEKKKQESTTSSSKTTVSQSVYKRE